MDWINPTFLDSSGSISDLKLPTKRRKTVTLTDHRRNRSSFTKKNIDVEALSGLWTAKYLPVNRDELVIHKKKIEEVSTALDTACSKKACLLVLHGPPGCGKTAAIKVLCAEKGIKLREWTTPVSGPQAEIEVPTQQNYADPLSRLHTSASSGQSHSAQFSDFLLRASRYDSQQLFSSSSSHNMAILVEDVPTVFQRDPSLLHALLRRYMSQGRCPLIMTLSSDSSSDSEYRKLCQSDVMSQLHAVLISFNSVAPTSVGKALQRIAQSERLYDVDIKRISSDCQGDLRSAINTLQFSTASIGRATGVRADIRKKSKTRSRPEKSTRGTDVPEEACGRDVSFFLFRAVGKILHAKRVNNERSSVEQRLAEHLKPHSRDPLDAPIENILDNCHVPRDLLISYVHHNYPSFYSNVQDIEHAAQALSDSDYLTYRWQSRSTLQDCGCLQACLASAHYNSARSLVTSAPLGWKPLYKPQFYTVQFQRNLRLEEAKNIFKGSRAPVGEMITDIAPYLHRLGTTNLADQRFYREVVTFPKYVSFNRQEALDERETVIQGNSKTIEVKQSQSSESQPSDNVTEDVQLDDIDCEIEEFSD